ncbi:MAG TPA: NAD-dependent epimerase/dehydratase family protein [Planctomycetota bacterium]|jgi:nucleoside-diphosphate-sugar epimerase|nr:NAD-dependent epimerase/dehydratase family protein [Planctomycetota bacterium]
MTKPRAVLITGANGEIGHGLIDALRAESPHLKLLALDLQPPSKELGEKCDASIVGNILDQTLIGRLCQDFELQTIFHLAALLSTSGERKPGLAHQVNVEGTINLLNLAEAAGKRQGYPVVFLFPSSIAVYGLPNRSIREHAPPVTEDQFTSPITMYGCNKLYCEHLGRYYSKHYMQLDQPEDSIRVDFRSIRFPGLISATTKPSGGTSDYGPEMIHEAAQGLPYRCFVSEDTALPFMAMPDAIRAILLLQNAKRSSLSTSVYNISAFNPTALDFAERTRRAFPGADIRFEPDIHRQRLVHSWPRSIDDSRARADWGFAPQFDFDRAFDDYLVPHIRNRYR